MALSKFQRQNVVDAVSESGDALYGREVMQGLNPVGIECFVCDAHNYDNPISYLKEQLLRRAVGLGTRLMVTDVRYQLLYRESNKLVGYAWGTVWLTDKEL